jgi:hypothetical protein
MKGIIGLSAAAIFSHATYVAYTRRGKKMHEFNLGSSDVMLMDALHPGDIILFERNFMHYQVILISIRHGFQSEISFAASQSNVFVFI